MRVLIIEDHQVTRRAVSRLLQNHGIEIVEADSAEQAKACVVQHRCDVIISDIELPDGDGVTLLQDLRSLSPDTPAIAVTALDSKEDKSRIASAGFSAHLVKPITISALLGELRKLCPLEPCLAPSRAYGEE